MFSLQIMSPFYKLQRRILHNQEIILHTLQGRLLHLSLEFSLHQLIYMYYNKNMISECKLCY